MPRREKKFPAISPQFYFIFIKQNAIWKWHHITYKAWSNLCKLDVANTKKKYWGEDLGKKSWSLSNTESRSDVLLKRPDRCKLEQFEASRHKGRSGRKVLVVQTDDDLDSWASGRYDKSSRRLAENRIFWLVNFAESSRSTLNNGIPVKKASLQRSDFVQQNVANYKLTIFLFHYYSCSVRHCI